MKLPEKAKKVFDGVIFDVYQWEQELFDGTTTTFEMLKRPNTLQILATQGDKILLSEEEQPAKGKFVGFLGGRQDPGEDPLTGSKRELLEETGLASDDWSFLKTFEPYTKIEWEVHFFVARECKKVQEIHQEGGERIKPKQVTFEEFVEEVAKEEFCGQEFSTYVLRLERDGRLEELRKAIFGT